MESVIHDTKTWSSIDIYVFSNGQEYSPPRKYHLRSEELQWWATTVSYLGRTHYGSGHSAIDLYTTDGIKINGPLELINGAAYVAVEPPDTFINTGYEEYLVKASRSWDKRLLQKSALNTEATDTKLNVTLDDTVTSIENATSNVGDNKNTCSQKSSPVKSRQPQRNSIVNAKQIQKRKQSNTQNSTLKRMCTDTNKVFPCPKKTSLRNEVSNRKRLSIVPCKRNISGSKDQSTFSKTASSIKSEKSPNGEYHGVDPYTKASDHTENLRYPLLACDDSLVLKTNARKKRITSGTIPDEVQTVISLYENKEQDIISITSNAESDQIIDKSVHKQNSLRQGDLSLTKENRDLVQQEALTQEAKVINKIDDNTFSVDKISTKYDYDQNTFLVNNNIAKNNNENINAPLSKIPSKENITKNKFENETIISNSRDFNKQATDEYVAYLNKGVVLLLKFNIKVKDCKTIFNRNKSNNIQLTSSLTNLLKTEKISQVDIDVNFSGEVLNANDEQSIQDKSLQYVLNKLYTEDTNHTDSKRPRIIILKCACRDYSKYDRERTDNECECADGEVRSKQKVIPEQKLIRTFSCCQCYNETYITKEIPRNNVPNASLMEDDRPSILKTNGTRVSYLAQKFENSHKTQPNNDRTSRNDSHTQSKVMPSLNEKILEGSNEHPVSEDVYLISKNVCDKCIQTDWSNVILEARHHEDDNYSFHLPSLYVLKQCKL